MTEQKKQNALITMIDAKRESLRSVFPSYMNGVDFDLFLKRNTISVLQNKDIVKYTQTERGVMSLYMCIFHACENGFQLGGLSPHAYIVPFGDEAALIPSAAGYRFIVNVDDPVLSDYIQKPVYDGDDCHIDAMTGEVKHSINITETKRKLIGIYAVFVELNGNKHADYMSRGDIESIRDKWSKQPEGKAWKNAFESMAMNKAAKHFLKPYAEQKEALRRIMALDETQAQPDNRPISDRVADALDGVIDAEIVQEGPDNGQGKAPEQAPAEAAGAGPAKKGKAPF